MGISKESKSAIRKEINEYERKKKIAERELDRINKEKVSFDRTIESLDKTINKLKGDINA